MVVGVGCCALSSQAEAASVSLNLGNNVRLVLSDNKGVCLKHHDVKKKKMVKKDFRRDKFRDKNHRLSKGNVKRRHRC